jgi:hypothetical protein
VREPTRLIVTAGRLAPPQSRCLEIKSFAAAYLRTIDGTQ